MNGIYVRTEKLYNFKCVFIIIIEYEVLIEYCQINVGVILVGSK